jgi:mono/diheme cytochrome c family protein
MRSDLLRSWRGVLTIAATYVAFLLFAQFGFLTQLQSDLGDVGRVRAAMAAMGVSGLAASLGTAFWLGRAAGPRLVRVGLGAVAVVAALSVVCHGFPSLLAVAAATGASIGLLTVAVAASLPRIVAPRVQGVAVGLATGAAYFISNLPFLFAATPALRALVPAALALAALAFAPSGDALPAEPETGTRREMGGLIRLLITFLILIWLDSAAFAIVQASPELKARTWGTAGQQLLQGSVHLVAALGAGALLDAGFGLAVPLAAWGLFAVAFPLLQGGGAGAALAGPLYAVGISFYSAALVVMPSWRARDAVPPPRWRAGLLYGVAGWIGSALGVGMAQNLGRIPAWFLGVTGAGLALAWFSPRLFPWLSSVLGPLRRLYGPTLGIALAVLLPVFALRGIVEPGESRAAVARGRRVYVEEGCIHCHSQYVRAGTRDEVLWGPSRPLDRGERPPLVGVRRQGPDLLAVGNRRGAQWQEAHLRAPRLLSPGSRMPSYAHLFAGEGERGRDLVAYLGSLGAGTQPDRQARTRRQPVHPAPYPPSPARGAALFASWCASCHGAGGRGDGRLAAALSDRVADLGRSGAWSATRGAGTEIANQDLARVIRYGLAPGSMPGHEWLTDQQVGDLTAFVRTLETIKEDR